jgi:hypothetical protein
METPPDCVPHASPEGQELGHSAPSQTWVRGQPPSPHWHVETQKFMQAQKFVVLQVSVPPPSSTPASGTPACSQNPLMQGSMPSGPTGQTCPQLPQLPGSICVSVHSPLQTVSPLLQPSSQAQVPASHWGMQKGWTGQSQNPPASCAAAVHAGGTEAPSSMRQAFSPSWDCAMTQPPHWQPQSLQ